MPEVEIHGEKRLTAASFSEFALYVEREAPPNAIFRGHAKSSWHLIPEVHRGGVISAKTADERVRAEEAMLKEFMRQARSVLPHLPRNDWEWLCLARHYGLPTRLLDWTENAAAALFFAVEYPNGGVDGAVWCSERPNEVDVTKSPFKVDDIYLYDPPHIAPRITAQSACVTVHPTDYIGKKYEWPRKLVKLIVPAQSRSKIRATLRAHGIHRASLFPEPAGIAEEIGRRHHTAEDESELVIMFAYYGANGLFFDITESLRSHIENGKLKTDAGNHLAGDPCPGVKKELQIIYAYQGTWKTQKWAEGEEVSLP
jgi:FRG domain